MNDLKLIGRLTKDPEAPTEYQGGSKMLRFSLAVKREYKTKDGQDADFFNLTAWNRNADTVFNHLRKGSLIAVHAHLSSGSYTDKDGNTRYHLDIIADRIEFLSRKNETAPDEGDDGGHSDASTPGGFDQEFMKVDDNDLPF